MLRLILLTLETIKLDVNTVTLFFSEIGNFGPVTKYPATCNANRKLARELKSPLWGIREVYPPERIQKSHLGTKCQSSILHIRAGLNARRSR